MDKLSTSTLPGLAGADSKGFFTSTYKNGLFQCPRYSRGRTFLAPRRSHVLRTKGMVKAGSPKGKSQVAMLAVKSTVKQAPMTPSKRPKRLVFILKTMDTATIVKIAL